MSARILTGDALEALRAIAEDVDPGRPLETVAEVRALPDRVRAVLAERDAALARVARLERVLAVEAGDESAAPEGWSLNDSGHWTKGQYRVIHPSYWALCEVGDFWFRPFNFALEAMEAADAAAGEVAT